MKHFMVVWTDGTESGASFFDKMDEVDSYITNGTCGVGLLMQCYEWDTRDREYKFLFE